MKKFEFIYYLLCEAGFAFMGIYYSYHNRFFESLVMFGIFLILTNITIKRN